MLDRMQTEQYTERYYSDILHYCGKKLSREDAEDVTQEVFMLLQYKAADLEEKNIRAWLYGVATKKTLEKYRENKKGAKRLTDLETADTTALTVVPTEDAKVEHDFDIDALKERILAKLNAAERELYKLVHVDKEKYADVAQKLNITTKAVSVRVVRLRYKIKNYVSDLFRNLRND